MGAGETVQGQDNSSKGKLPGEEELGHSLEATTGQTIYWQRKHHWEKQQQHRVIPSCCPEIE